MSKGGSTPYRQRPRSQNLPSSKPTIGRYKDQNNIGPAYPVANGQAQFGIKDNLIGGTFGICESSASRLKALASTRNTRSADPSALRTAPCGGSTAGGAHAYALRFR